MQVEKNNQSMILLIILLCILLNNNNKKANFNFNKRQGVFLIKLKENLKYHEH